MPGKVGRPPGAVKRPPEEVETRTPAEIGAALGIEMRYFDFEMREFFLRGQGNQLQRWFVASGSRQKAEVLASLMVDRFAEQLASLLDGTKLSE